jgi:PhzF family phenazine biosynthesis protein
MAALARWTNLVETTFLLQPSDPAADYRLRIFTPESELPFAGHPTLGSARAWLVAGGEPARRGQVVQECGAGLVRLREEGERLWFAAPALVRDGPVSATDRELLCKQLGLAPGDVVDAHWTDNGPGWVSLLLKDAATVLAIDAPRERFGGFNSIGVIGPYAAGKDADFEVRAFIPEIGSGEDPVTGSLNAGMAQWLIAAGHAPSAYVVSQGTCLRRRGRVFVEQQDADVWVGGHTTVGVRGSVALPTP